MEKADYILWLCSWYPNDLKPLEGDFVQRHAIAVSSQKQIVILSLCHDATGKITKDIKMVKKSRPNLEEITLYYHTSQTGFTPLDKLLMMRSFLKEGKKALENLFIEKGKPVFIHVHIIMNMGMLAEWANAKYNIPYMLSEQWVAYLPEAKPNYRDFNPWSRKQWQKITSKAKGITVVSEWLGSAIHELNPKLNPIRIPNVVDQSIFYPRTKEDRGNHPKRFLHISTGGYQKNLEAIVAAFDLLSQEDLAFQLDLVLSPEVANDKLFQKSYIKLHPEMDQPALAELIRETDALILYSRYETFGCVVIEANACGVPVIGSDIPVLREIIKDGENGLLVAENNPEALAICIKSFPEEMYKFKPQHIVDRTIELYNYQTIADKFTSAYNQIFG